MKMAFFTALIFTLIPLSFATESLDITLSKDNPSRKLTLKDDEYRNIYSTGTRTTTCEREVLDRDNCHMEGSLVCDNQGRRCTAGITRPQCYRTERYRCEESYTYISGTEFVKTHVNNIEVKLSDNLAKKYSSVFDLKVIAKHDKVSIKLNSEFPEALLEFKKEVKASATQVTISAVATKKEIDFITNTEIQLKDFKASRTSASFKIVNGKVYKDVPSFLLFNIETNPLIGIDIEIFGEKLDVKKLSADSSDSNDLTVRLNCKDKSMPCLKRRRYDFFFTLRPQIQKNYLNVNSFKEFFNKQHYFMVLKVRPKK